MICGGQDRRRRAARNHRLEFPAAAHAARHLQQRRERRAQLHFVIARPVDMARNGKQLGAAVVGLAQREEGFAAVVDDPGHRGESLGVVDGGGLAVQAVARRERRLEARLALLALDRLEQAGLLAADVGAPAVHRVAARTRNRCRGCSCPGSRRRAPRPGPARTVRIRPRSRRECSCSRCRFPWRRRRSAMPSISMCGL